MIDNVTSMYKPNSEQTLEYAREVIDRSLQLAQTQIEVTAGMFSKASQEYRDMLQPSEPHAMLRNWPKVLESTTRGNAEGVAILLKNAIGFQNEMFQMMQSRMPELSKQMMDGLIKTTQAAAQQTVAAERSSRQSNGGRSNGFKASKAA